MTLLEVDTLSTMDKMLCTHGCPWQRESAVHPVFVSKNRIFGLLFAGVSSEKCKIAQKVKMSFLVILKAHGYLETTEKYS